MGSVRATVYRPSKLSAPNQVALDLAGGIASCFGMHQGFLEAGRG
jgi:hypothetical protein